MRLIYTDGFPLHERKEVRQVIFSNMVVAFKIIAEEMRDLGLQYENKETEVCWYSQLNRSGSLIVCRNSKEYYLSRKTLA